MKKLIALSIIAFSLLSNSAHAQTANARATSTVQTCTIDGSTCPLNVDMSSRLRVLLFGSNATVLESSDTSASTIANTAISLTTKSFNYGYDTSGLNWNRIRSVPLGVGTGLAIVPMGINNAAAFRVTGVTTAQTLVSGFTTVAVFSVPPTAAGSVITFYDNASACSGNVKMIIESASTYPPQNIIPQAPINFTNGVTVCATTAANVVIIRNPS